MKHRFKTLLTYCENYLSFWRYLLFYDRLRPKTFAFGDETYQYLNHVYNTTWRNERTVEVPIAWREVNAEKCEILEVGNVLSHYYSVKHDVVDLYEKATHVINEDICLYTPAKKYDLVVCISTLEHVGGKARIIDAFNNIVRMLKAHGRILFTVPIGFNSDLDLLIRSEALPFTGTSYLVRYSDMNLWKESDAHVALSLRFDFRIPRANAILIGYYE